MSFARQRVLPLATATVIGVTSGVYIFDPLIKQYRDETRGTFKPEVAEGGIKENVTTEMGKAAETAKEALQGDSHKQDPSLISRGVDAIKQKVNSGPVSSSDTTTRNAEEQRTKATMNAATRAKDAALDRAQKTGDGKVVQ